MDETKIIYYVDDEETPYLIKFHTSPDQITLSDFKSALNKPNYKFFFKSLDDDFGVVKEEITDDDCKLPCVNGKVVSWLVIAEGSTQSDNHSSSGKEILVDGDNSLKDIISDSSDPKSPTLRSNKTQKKQQDETKRHKSKYKFTGPEKISKDETDDAFDELDSIYNEDKLPPLRKFSDYKHTAKMKKIRSVNNGGSSGVTNHILSSMNGAGGYNQPVYESSSSMMSSDIDTTSFFDSEDESSRFSSATETTMSSKYGRQRRQLRRRRKMPHLSRASSFSSMTDSTVSLNIITVTFEKNKHSYLGISIVGQTQENRDGGIYVGSIMKDGAVAQDGRIESGDMILEVNGISFESVSNEEAVQALREEIHKPGPVTLVVAKSWDPPGMHNNNDPPVAALPMNQTSEPVRPIDPRAWIMHTALASADNSMNPANSGMPPPMQGGNFITGPGGYLASGAPVMMPAGLSTAAASTLTTTSSSLRSSSLLDQHNNAPCPTTNAQNCDVSSLTISSDPALILHAMSLPDSGLLIRNRLWLKITIYNAFIGSDLVDWLLSHVHGFGDRKDARKFAAAFLKSGHIRHTVNKSTFSEQCYYVLNDELHSAFSTMNLDSEIDSVSVIAGQQATASSNKARMIQQQQQQHHYNSNNSSKDSPILSSGFQSGCSNKWSSFQPAPPQLSSDIHNAPSLSYNLYQNSYNPQQFYNDSMQSQQPPNMKNLSSLSHGLSTNLNNMRTTGSVHSGSVVAKNCVCLQSMGVMKAVKNLWDSGNKPIAADNKSVDSSNSSSNKSATIPNNTATNIDSNSQQQTKPSVNDSNEQTDECKNSYFFPTVNFDGNIRNNSCALFQPGSSASGSSNNMINRTLTSMQSVNPSLQQQYEMSNGMNNNNNNIATTHNGSVVKVPTMTMLAPGLTNHNLDSANHNQQTQNSTNHSHLQHHQIINNENSSSGFFSDVLDKND